MIHSRLFTLAVILGLVCGLTAGATSGDGDTYEYTFNQPGT